MPLTKRLEIRLDKQQYSVVKKFAQKNHSSVGAVIRDAIDKIYLKDDVKERLAAVRTISKLNAPVVEVSEMLAEIEAGRLL